MGSSAARLPACIRLPETNRIFLDEYRQQFVADTEQVYLAYGDTITLLPKIKAPVRTVDVSGSRDPRGKFGGRRVTAPHVHEPAGEPTFGRPDPSSEIKIPAVVKIQPTPMEREQFGVSEVGSSLAYLPIKWLEDRGIEINTVEDMISYKNSRYRIIGSALDGNFLDTYSDLVLTISTEKAN